jgi:hypothetical protein
MAAHDGTMTTWTTVLDAAPDLGAAVQHRFEAHLHHVLATVRRDGSPRVSGTEVTFRQGHLWLGSMGGSRKALDLQRDPRLALHSAPIDVTMAEGDAKVGGRAVEVTDPGEVAAWLEEGGGQAPPGPMHLFRVQAEEVVLTSVVDGHLVVDSWTATGGLRRVDPYRR